MIKTSIAALLTLGLLGAAGCNRGTPGGPRVTAPTTEAAAPHSREAHKPILGEADNTFSLKMPMNSVTVAQGEEQGAVIEINRGRNFGGDVTLQVADLPTGVTLTTVNPQIRHGSMDAQLMFKAADDAALGDFTIKVEGQPAQGANSTNTLKLTVAQK